MSGAYCQRFPACMSFSDKPQAPQCDKGDCPGQPQAHKLFTATVEPAPAAAPTPVALTEPNGLANLRAIMADRPFMNSVLTVAQIEVILENKGGFMPDEAVMWFRECDDSAATVRSGLDLSHLNALELRLSHERGYLANAKTQNERELRNVWIAQIEKEIAHERDFLGLEKPTDVEMTDDELLRELGA